MQSLIERLRTDFAKKTLGELIQEREAAAFEIERLTREVADSCARHSLRQQEHFQRPAATPRVTQEPKHPRTMLRLADVCAMVGLSRSSIYLAMGEGRFPRAVRIGVRAVRWKVDDIQTWLREKGAQ